jgi:hypothetical protein
MLLLAIRNSTWIQSVFHLKVLTSVAALDDVSENPLDTSQMLEPEG